MHYLLEIVLPPTDNLEEAIEEILHPFDENLDDDDEAKSSQDFWDWYVIGGRWAGAKVESKCGKDKIAKFSEELRNRNVTVSGLRFGKHELNPATQIPMVDALWREWFPDSGVDVCPIFKHSGKAHKGHMPLDICTVAELPDEHTAARVIVAGQAWAEDGLEAKTMLARELWNGVSFQDTTFSGKVREAIEKHHDGFKHAADEYREKNTVTDEWLVVSVDYHT